MVILITYDLNKRDKDYTSLISAIKDLGDWRHDLTSVWLVETNLSTSQINNRLSSLIDSNDELLIIKVQKDYMGWLPQAAWDWLNSRQAY